jgi:hypothetical protein
MEFEYIRCSKFQGADFDTDHYPVLAKAWERMVVSKQAGKRLRWKDFN